MRRRDVLAPIKSRKSQKADADLDEGIELSSVSDGSSAQEDNEMEADITPESSEQESEGEDLENEDEDEGVRIAKTASGKVKGARGRNERVMSAAEVRGHLRLLFVKEAQAVSLLYGRHGGPSSGVGVGKSTGKDVAAPVLADMFFMDVIPVTPTRFRPAARMGEELFENSQNSLLSAVITTCQRIQDLNTRLHDQARAEQGEMELAAIAKAEGTRTFELLLEAIIKLQHDVNSFMDSTKNPQVMRQGKLPPQGVKQLLEKKEGLFRKHMMVSTAISLLHRFKILGLLTDLVLRASVSTTPLDPSFPPTSTLRPMRSAFLPSSPRNSRTPNRSLRKTYTSCVNSSSTARGCIPVHLSCRTRTVRRYLWTARPSSSARPLPTSSSRLRGMPDRAPRSARRRATKRSTGTCATAIS